MTGWPPAALVTGARRGIGRAAAEALAAAGFDIVVNDLEADHDLDATRAAIEAQGSRAASVTGDIARIEDHAGLVARAVAAFGRLDCLVNNAGVSVLSRGDLLEVTPESYDRCQSVNTRGTFFLAQSFARYLLNEAPPTSVHRSIVIVSSANAAMASVDRGEYCISKTGLGMVAKLFALRLAGAGIGVYEIRPGIIATEMIAPARERYERFIAEGGVPEPRMGAPADIGRAVATLASGRLTYATGQTLTVDGGLAIPRL